jgi:hypothetical protein
MGEIISLAAARRATARTKARIDTERAQLMARIAEIASAVPVHCAVGDKLYEVHLKGEEVQKVFTLSFRKQQGRLVVIKNCCWSAYFNKPPDPVIVAAARAARSD